MADNNDFQHVFGRDWQQRGPQQHQQEQQRAQPSHQPAEEEPSRKKAKKRSAGADGGDGAAAAADDDPEEGGAGSQAMVFPVKLHRMLTHIDEKTNTDKDSTTGGNVATSDDASIVSWQPHGRCFLVHDKEAFVQRFLPSYFRQSKWASFQRQLNIYGFQRLTAGRDRGAYYHDLFLRGHPELATRIHRMKLKGIGQGRHRTNAELEPNFYRMKPVGAGDQIDAAVIGLQPNASAAAMAYASGQAAAAPAPTVAAAAPQAPTSTVNVLQLFGGGNAAGSANPTGLPVVANTTDLTNVFFLTNGNELASLQNLGSVTAGGGGSAMRDASDSNSRNANAHQEGLQSAQHLSLLANLFNAANTTTTSNNNSINAGSAAGEAPTSLNSRTNAEAQESTNSNADDINQWSSSNLFAGNSNLALLHNPDANLLTTATLMQYMGDSNDGPGPSSHSQSPTEPTANALASAPTVTAPRSTSQSPWASVGFNPGDTSTITSASATRGNGLVASNSSNDLINTFRFDGPSLRRMSAAAMSSLLTANGSNPVSASNPFDSNPNLLLFSSLNQSRNSSSNLLEASSADPSAALTATATQALNRLAAVQQPSNRDTTATAHPAVAPGPAPTPASQQLAYINAAASVTAAQAPNSGQSGYLFGDLLSARAATTATQPTFLDSVYEPIPIKENANATGEVAGPAGSSAQQKLSPTPTGASADPTHGGGGRSGFHHLPSGHQR